MEKDIHAKMIVDLMLMKNHLIPQWPTNNPNVINPNITYCVFETIIAHLMDKYNIENSDVREALIKRETDAFNRYEDITKKE